ncbi:hypothetical protein CLI72_06090 [Porphyromonas gingivalis]|uniref:tyrosine-type recombinase/integrase n=1 Tax=Porphyromonas gingivalis TaxID=837 RepID=UPI000BE76336|nr:tyrosine-type recombinase/integrase [Porphyromonas gingivalis]PDP81800.1 hypothetical protein CLI72_06090 [Porphyromonas gingivalis]
MNTRITTYLRAYAERKRCSANHKGNMRNAARYLERYEEYVGHHIEGKDFDYLCIESFFAYMRQNYDLRHNTIVKIAQTIVAAVNRMRREGIQVGRDYEDFPLKEEEVTTVALSDEEVERIYQLRLNKKSAIIRDLFVFACETGLRYYDLVALQDDNIQGNILTVRTAKTGALVCIPLRRRARQIIAKHGGAVKYTDSQTNYNKCVKTLCRKAGITEKVLCEYTVGTRLVRRSVPKHKLVSSHTGRRSFATNAYLAGIPTVRIMLITGHKTEQAFFRYIRVGKKENAKALSELPFFK